MPPSMEDNQPQDERSDAAANSSVKKPHSTAPSSPKPSDAKSARRKSIGNKDQSGKSQKDTGDDNKISGKEAKMKAKAEKAARREKERQERQGPSIQNLNDAKTGTGQALQQQSTTAAKTAPSSKGHHRRKSSAAGHAAKALSLRPGALSTGQRSEEPKKEDKRVASFEHLYGHPRRHTIAGASKDIHPSILTLGLQLSNYKILGSNVRCAATLLALQDVITAYTTPVGNSLPRHLTTHLANQIDYLVSCRPLSVSQGNAIRWLKVKISAVDIATPEDRAKAELCNAIDEFIRERIVVADEVITAHANEKIKTGDTILTYARSTVVERTLLKSHAMGKKFEVIAIDSHPLYEGRDLARNLAEAGIRVQYALVTDLTHVAPKASKIMLGAHAVMANGSLYSRVGTAMVALAAKTSHLPVIVCCESVKLTERALLDSFVHNELAPEDELIPLETEDAVDEHPLTRWRDVPGLQLLNLMYDVTPAELIDVVITEHGNMPPTSAMAVARLSANT